MLGHQDRWQEDLFVAGPLRDLVPDDHVLKRVDAVLDLAWLGEEVCGSYNEPLGRPGTSNRCCKRTTLPTIRLHRRKAVSGSE